MSMSDCVQGRRCRWRDDDLEAYQQNSKGFKKGISTVEAVEHYSEWADCHRYDQDLCPGRYNGPRISADVIAAWFTDEREKKKIIDIAAGTGFVGHNLRSLGFRHIDALEPSPKMLQRAKEKDIYENLYSDYLTDDPIPGIDNDTYDCAVVCGGMGEGHIPCSGVKELIRITKPGGLICIVMREQYLYDVEEYNDRLEPMMDFLEMSGKWRRISRAIVPDYFIDLTGIVYMYAVV